MLAPELKPISFVELPLVSLSQVMGTRPGEGKPKRINAAGLCLRARTMAAREKARARGPMRGGKDGQRWAFRLEQQARRWVAQGVGRGGASARPLSPSP